MLERRWLSPVRHLYPFVSVLFICFVSGLFLSGESMNQPAVPLMPSELHVLINWDHFRLFEIINQLLLQLAPFCFHKIRPPPGAVKEKASLSGLFGHYGNSF